MFVVRCRAGACLAAVQIERPLQKDDFSKLVFKTLGVQLAPAVVDIVYAVFGDANGRLDGPTFAAIMKSRNRVPGYRVSCRATHFHAQLLTVLLSVFAAACDGGMQSMHSSMKPWGSPGSCSVYDLQQLLSEEPNLHCHMIIKGRPLEMHWLVTSTACAVNVPRCGTP